MWCDMALTLDDLWQELQRGKIYECALRDRHWHLDGLRDGDSVFVDPSSTVVHTLLHELIHRRYPKWGERTVTRQARRLMSQLDEVGKRRWWRAYRRVKKTRPPLEVP